MKRRKMSSHGSRALFTATAMKTDPKNLQAVPMRGGFRI